MAKSNIISAIDIGSSKITTLVAQVNYDQITGDPSVNIIGVASTSSRGIKKGQIVDIEEAVEATIESVEASERMAGFNLDRAFISVGGGHVASQNSSGVVAISNPENEINEEDVDRVIEAARAVSLPSSREIIHVIPREYIVDGEPGVRDPVGMTGVRLEVDTHLVTASSPALKNLTKTVNDVGVEIEEAVFSGLASSYATVTDTEKELGCVLLDIGSGTTTIAAFVEGALAYSSAIPIGARNVTNDLAIGLRVSLDAAEKIKLDLVDDKPYKDQSKKDKQIEIPDENGGEIKSVQKRTLIEGIIRPRLNEIFSMVKMDLDRSNIINRIPSGAIITGGGSLTVGVADASKKVLGLPVRLASPEGVGGLTDDIMEAQFSTAIGLILYGVKNTYLYAGKPVGGTGKNIQLPNKAIFSKLVSTIKDLLP